MDSFSFAAGVLTGILATLTGVSLRRRAIVLGGRLRLLLAGGALVTFAAAAAILYFAVSARHGLPGQTAGGATTVAGGAPMAAGGAPMVAGGAPMAAGGAPARSMQDAVAGLEARLARGGGSPADWELLAKAYDFLGRADDARRAREHMLSPSATATNNVSVPALADAASAAGNASGQGTRPRGEISGTVSIDSGLAARVPPDATLFIYAKAADSPGPPLAVLRTTASSWPVRFRLDDSMAMVPSRRLSQFDKVVIEARISRSGQATPESGDLFVTSPVVDPGAGAPLALVINREID
jgi:hypothetical protein